MDKSMRENPASAPADTGAGAGKGLLSAPRHWDSAFPLCIEMGLRPEMENKS